MIDDYYNKEEFILKLKKFQKITSYGKDNKFYDIFLKYLELPDNIKQNFNELFEIDKDAYLFYLTRLYACNYRNILERNTIKKHPYIKKIVKEKDSIHLNTLLGDSKFKFWIKNSNDIMNKSIKNTQNGKISDIIDIYFKEYTGQFNGKCHEASIVFGYGNKVITGLVNYPIKNMRFLHSFVEGKKYILDATINSLFLKDDYFKLLKPEIISEIKGEELYAFKDEYMSKYPRLRHMSTKQLLVEFEEIKKNPKTIKLRPY